MVMKRKIFSGVLLIIDPAIDFVLVVISVVLAYYFYLSLEIGKIAYDPLELVTFGGVVFSLTVVAILFRLGTYNKESSLLNIAETTNTIKGVSLGFLLASLTLVLSSLGISRYVLLVAYILTLVTLPLCQYKRDTFLA